MDVPFTDSTTEAESGPARIKATSSRQGTPETSYKFQRLREQLRVAISSGELVGKLPGERTLARRFHVNAKTLSKALTDLAAEGLLDRSIGRGTFVKGSTGATTTGRWLILSDPGASEAAIVHALRALNSQFAVATSVGDMRPSFLNQFSTVIDAASDTPEEFLRDLVVRNMPVVAVNREPKIYSMHAVLQDIALGVSRLGRDLALGGHRRFAVIEPPGASIVAATLGSTITRYAPDCTLDVAAPNDVPSLLDAGITAIVCGTCEAATQVKQELEKVQPLLPSRLSLAAVGCIGELVPCSGFYCSAAQVAEAVAVLLRGGASPRPSVLWLAGQWHDLGTTGHAPGKPVEESEHVPVREQLGR